ncbi:MAG: 4-(cytidine 5'-diphospho)-2-C-methyl-D-erythritol kinase [Butyrivibrio sp.]|nr:4-(cytidine 5'-diphospho)-2-C-methyl-D-erythritol kinase [Butyrivibrio sp.]
MIKKKAYAKINLALDVLGKREDGYHLVKMIMQMVDLYDELSFEKRDDGEILFKSASEKIPNDENNLVYKAAKLLKDRYKVTSGSEITLVKNIPVAAGMAGGSTDAAAAFIALNELWDLKLSKEELCKDAVSLGADIPYCIIGGTALSEGIGEELTALPDMPKCYILIAKPSIDVSTGWVYKTLDSREVISHPDVDSMVKAIKDGSLIGITSNMGNVLQTVTVPEYPVIEEIKDIMNCNGAMEAMMSGSGPTVFGIFDSANTMEKAYEAVRNSGLAPELYKSCPINPSRV